MIKLTPKQTFAFKSMSNNDVDFVLYGGAIRGGKSIWLLCSFVYLCQKYPKSRWAIIRQDLQTLRRTLLITWHEKIVSAGLSHRIRKFDTKTMTVTFDNGSQIIFMGENWEDDKELNKFRGLEVNGFGIDEINEIRSETFDKLFERAGSWVIPRVPMDQQPPPKILATCNPTQGWVKKRIYDRFKKNQLPTRWRYIPAKITDNEHLPKTYIDSLMENMTPLNKRIFIDGDWDAKTDQNYFATHFDNQSHIGFYQINPNLPLILAMDFNLNPFSVIAIQEWADKDGEHVRIVDQIEIKFGSIPTMIDEIKTRYARWLPTIKITGDYMGDRGDLSQRDNASYYMQIQRGLRLHESQIVIVPNPTHENSRADVNYFLYHFPDLKINPETAPGLIHDLENVLVDNKGVIIKRDRKDETQRADFLDGFRYYINTFKKKWIDRHQANAIKTPQKPDPKFERHS